MNKPLERLTNERWGFTSSCFACEPTNDRGLRIPFHHDTDAGLVVADFELGAAFSGAPSYLHGGVVLTVMDEAMAWATIAVAGTFALTRTTTATFDHPTRVGRSYRVEARVDAVTETSLATSAVIVDHKGRRCAAASAEFTPIGPARAADAVGQDLTGADTAFLRGDGGPGRTR